MSRNRRVFRILMITIINIQTGHEIEKENANKQNEITEYYMFY
jgi:hypothetical protein